MKTAQNAPEFNVDNLKKVVRLLDGRKRVFIENYWREHASILQKSQFNQLMLVRFIMPCDLGKIMQVTGLTSPGASLFVDKLVQRGILCRKDDKSDRRNIRISLSKAGQEYLKQVDDQLNGFIDKYLEQCTPQELADISKGTEIILRKLEKEI